MSMVESGAVYWHMVDLLWIVIFGPQRRARRGVPGHRGDATAVASVPITVTVVLLGLIKRRLVIRTFMEVRTAPRWRRCRPST
jgi:hypothetical protein